MGANSSSESMDTGRKSCLDPGAQKRSNAVCVCVCVCVCVQLYYMYFESTTMARGATRLYQAHWGADAQQVFGNLITGPKLPIKIRGPIPREPQDEKSRKTQYEPQSVPSINHKGAQGAPYPAKTLSRGNHIERTHSKTKRKHREKHKRTERPQQATIARFTKSQETMLQIQTKGLRD